MKKDTPMMTENEEKTAKVSSLPVYISIVFVVSLLISLVSFKLFWDSPARELSIEIQNATEEKIENPFLRPIDNSEIDVNNGILQTTEIDGLFKQTERLIQELNPQEDFKLNQNEELFSLLEF